MKTLVQFKMQDGTDVFVEGNERFFDDDDDLIPVSRSNTSKAIAIQAQETFEAAFNKTLPAIKHVATTLRELCPDEFELEFALTLNAKAGAVIAEVTSEANFKVNLKWQKEKNQPEIL